MARRLVHLMASAGLFLGLTTGAVQARDADLAQGQLHLKILGYEPGPVDGSIGGRTVAALEKFHADRGDSFDGTFDEDDIEALYDALAAVPFNGAPPKLDAATGRTTLDRAFDFVPPVDLTTLYTPLTELRPDGLADMISAVDDSDYCRATGEPFPAAGQPLQTYSSFREFETTGRRNLHPGVKWLEELSMAVQTSAPAAATGDASAARTLKAALLMHAQADSALHTANLVDRNGQLIAYPDFAAGSIATQALMANYLIARKALNLTESEQQVIEIWLFRLFETFPDSAFVLNPGIESVTQEVGRLGRSMMLHALMTNDVEQFNEGARVALTAASFVREDGSERLGAARGNRALFYQGTALMYAMETYVILSSQGVDAANIMGPTVHRLADFWGRAWHDHSVLFPYAQENASVYVGSDYRQQDQVQVSDGLDLYLPIAEAGASRDRLLEARAHFPFRRQIGNVFVSTCIGQALGPYDPPASTESAGGLGGIESSAAFALTGASIYVRFSNDRFTEYAVRLSGMTVGEEAPTVMRLSLFSDYFGSKTDVRNLELLRAVFMRSALTDPESRSADYSDCGHVAMDTRGSDQQLRLHWGAMSEQNACIMDKMGAGDRERWSAIMVNFGVVLDAITDSALAAEMRALHAHANR